MTSAVLIGLNNHMLLLISIITIYIATMTACKIASNIEIPLITRNENWIY